MVTDLLSSQTASGGSDSTCCPQAGCLVLLLSVQIVKDLNVVILLWLINDLCVHRNILGPYVYILERISIHLTQLAGSDKVNPHLIVGLAALLGCKGAMISSVVGDLALHINPF